MRLRIDRRGSMASTYRRLAQRQLHRRAGHSERLLQLREPDSARSRSTASSRFDQPGRTGTSKAKISRHRPRRVEAALGSKPASRPFENSTTSPRGSARARSGAAGLRCRKEGDGERTLHCPCRGSRSGIHDADLVGTNNWVTRTPGCRLPTSIRGCRGTSTARLSCGRRPGYRPAGVCAHGPQCGLRQAEREVLGASTRWRRSPLDRGSHRRTSVLRCRLGTALRSPMSTPATTRGLPAAQDCNARPA